MVKDIVLKTLGVTYSLKKYVDPVSISYFKTIVDGEFETGTIVIDGIKPDEFETLDMSRPIPTNSIVEIILDNDDVIQTYVAEDLVSPIMMNKKLYSHEIQLVEPVKILTRINTPAFTITQPKSAGFVITDDIFVRSLPIGNDTIFSGSADDHVSMHPSNYNFDNYNFMSSYNTFRTSEISDKGRGIILEEDDSVINLNFGEINIPETDNEKTIEFSLSFVNPQYNLEIFYVEDSDYILFPGTDVHSFNFSNASVDIEVLIKLNNQIIYSTSLIIEPSIVLNPIIKKSRQRFTALNQSTIVDFKEGKVETGLTHRFRIEGSPATSFNFARVEKVKKNEIIKKVKGFGVDLEPNVKSLHGIIELRPEDSGDLTIEIVKNQDKWNMEYKFITIPGASGVSTFETFRNKKLLIPGGSLSISTGDDEIKKYKPLYREINKILSLNDRHQISLDEQTKMKILNVKAPELSYDSNNMYEVLRDIGSYIGAIPKLRLVPEKIKTWIPATEAEYNAGINRLQLQTLNLIDELNKYYKNYSLGYTAKLIGPEGVDYEFIPTTITDWNNSENKFDLIDNIGRTPTKEDVWRVLKRDYPGVMYDISMAYKTTVFRFYNGVNYTYWELEKLENLTTMYSKIIETDITISNKYFYYDFYNEIERDNINKLMNSTIEARSRNVEDYVSSIELNVDNLVSLDEVVNTGWLRITGTTGESFEKINTDNIGLKLPNGPIYEIKKVLLQLNKSFKMEDETVIPADEIFDVTDLVIEESFYNTLYNKSEYTTTERKFENTKNQVLYYKQGDDMIYNMGFTGTHPPVHEMSGTISANRAIYEMAAKKAVNQYDTNTKNKVIDPGKLEDDFNIRLLFEYIPMTSSRVNIYKDDQSGFEENTSKYYNEQQKFNDTELLGITAQSKINRMGNTEIERDGSTSNINFTPKLGTLDEENGRILTKINQVFLPNRVDYTTTHVKDYSTINEYFGIQSAYRQYEIPRENVVSRVDKKEIHAYVGFEPFEKPSRFGITTSKLFKHLDVFNRNMITPQMARIITRDKYNIVKADIVKPINTKTIGKNITHTFEMLDNYSAGKYIEERFENDEVKYFQRDIEYADGFGNIERIEIGLYHSDDMNNITNELLEDFENYPMWDKTKTPDDYNLELISEYNHIINKDTREKYSFSQDIRYFSDSDKITIFPGMAKYSVLGNIPEAVIELGIITKPISKSAIKVNRGDILSFDHNIMFEDGKPYYWDLNDEQLDFHLELGFENLSYCGVVIYEVSSMEPLMVINMMDEYKENNETLTGTLYFGIDDFQDIFTSPDLPKTLSPIMYGVYMRQTDDDEWVLSVKIKNNDGSPVEININGNITEEFNPGEIKFLDYKTVYSDPFGSDEYITAVSTADGKIQSNITAGNYNVQELDIPPTTKYTVTFKRGWDNTIIKTQQVTRRGNATFPTNIEINYGMRYEYDYHTGTYLNVMSDQTVIIYRRVKTAKWVRKTEVVSFLPPTTPGAAPARGESCSIVGQRYDTGIGMNKGDNQYSHIYLICESELEPD